MSTAKKSMGRSTSPDMSSDGSTKRSTSSRGTRILGASALFSLGLLVFLGLYFTGPEDVQGEAVRPLYVHVPTVVVAYTGFFITMVASIRYLWKGNIFWDLVAGTAAEVGVVFCTFVMISGALWGRITWGVYWVWDPRLTSTAVMYVMYIGYLALRRLDLDSVVRSRRAAVLGIVSFLNVIIVRQSVTWWRGLHQEQSFGIDMKITDIMLFTIFVGFIAFGLVFAWLMLHRFRLAWLTYQLGEQRLERALVARKAESGGIAGSVDAVLEAFPEGARS